jgi:uncharacterized membrane protein YphA (DoxX/SURF4 family)
LEGEALVRTISYWVATVLVALAYLAGGYFEVTRPPDVVEAATHLGYPLYFFTILGVWKLLAVVALLSPGLPRLKEWAYAGILINLTGAAATHAFVKDSVGDIVTPLVLLAVAVASWVLRPADRRLPGPWL